MSSCESYDGLCGIIHLAATSDKQVRCKYEFGHAGSHSWEGKQVGLSITGGIRRGELWVYGAPTSGRKRVVIGH